MKIYMLFIFIGLLNISTAQSSMIKNAEQFVSSCFGTEHDYSNSYDLCSDELKENLPFDQFKKAIEDVNKQLGSIERIIQTCESSSTSYVKVKYSKISLVWQISFDSDGMISGFFTRMDQPCKPKVPLASHERFIQFNSNGNTMSGILSVPLDEKQFPIVLLLQGSGSHNADYIIGETSYFKNLADSLQKKGIASIRLDKRSIKYPETVKTLYNEQIQDAVNILKTTDSLLNDSISRTFILGHSLGVTSAIEVAGEITQIDGIIGLAGSTRNLIDILFDQVKYLDSKGDSNEELLKKIDFAKDSLTENTSADQLPFNVPASYWLYLNELNTYEKYLNSTVRTLTINGKSDYQVGSKDIKLWSKIERKNDSHEHITLESINHTMSYEKEIATPNSYDGANEMDSKVFCLITTFILFNE